jgi:hypothetical protein
MVERLGWVTRASDDSRTNILSCADSPFRYLGTGIYRYQQSQWLYHFLFSPSYELIVDPLLLLAYLALSWLGDRKTVSCVDPNPVLRSLLRATDDQDSPYEDDLGISRGLDEKMVTLL